MEEKASEYVVLNCEECGEPVVKLSRMLLEKIQEALHFEPGRHPHFYHPQCLGGFEKS